MPKIEKPPFRIKRVIINARTRYASSKYQLLGRRSFFGRDVRQYFKTAAAATARGDQLVTEIRSHGNKATPFSDVERADAVKAMELLHGITDLVTAAKFFIKYGPQKTDITIREAATKFAATRGMSSEVFNRKAGSWRPKTIRECQTHTSHSEVHRWSIRTRLQRFLKAFGGEPIRSFGVREREIRDYLTNNFANPQTLQNHRATLQSFFAWAEEQKYLAGNPARPWTQQKQQLLAYSKQHKPGILRPTQLGDLLHLAESHDPEMIAYLAIGGYSGVRPDELSKLRWEDVKQDIIHIPASISKTGDESELSIHAPLARWLEVSRKSSGSVAPTNCARRRLQLWRRLHGAVASQAGEPKKTNFPDWPNDALRHSYGSYRFRATRDIALVCREMRHEDPATFRKHYLHRGLTVQEAEEYFAARPGLCPTQAAA